MKHPLLIAPDLSWVQLHDVEGHVVDIAEPDASGRFTFHVPAGTTLFLSGGTTVFPFSATVTFNPPSW